MDNAYAEIVRNKLYEHLRMQMFKRIKVISGGQTGADQGGLFGAEAAGVLTGGFAPKNYRTEDGDNPELLRDRFGLVETDSRNYLVRTELNVQAAHATLLVGRSYTPGCRQTLKFCRQLDKPYKVVVRIPQYETDVCETADVLMPWFESLALKFGDAEFILNVAGNRESTNPGIFDYTKKLIELVCRRIYGSE